MAEGRILIVDDDADIRLALSLLLMGEGYQVSEADGPKQLSLVLERLNPDLVLLDMNFSYDTTSGKEGLEILPQLVKKGVATVLMTAWGNIELAVKGMQLGAVDFIEKPWKKTPLLTLIADQLEKKRNALTINQPSSKINQTSQKTSLSQFTANGWIAESEAMQTLDALVQQIAPTDANILILGDNGTGKSALAKRIHECSLRATGPLVSVNMGAVPENLFESELFGHKKGAFTDAKEQRLGRFALAASGSLFLDEIGTLPLAVQPKLLRVLETGEYEMLGASQTQQAKVRLISATNADLQALVAEGSFRQDLLFRLNTFVLTLPSLQERQADIAPLSQHFIDHFCQKYQRGAIALSAEALAALTNYEWPGNIRELSHVMERAVLLCRDGIIEKTHILLSPTASTNPTQNPNANPSLRHLDDIEREMVERALQCFDGNISKAAQALGISRNALYRRMEKFNIDNPVTENSTHQEC